MESDLRLFNTLSRKKEIFRSRGNITSLEDLAQKGYDPRHVRFFLIYGHYRDTLDLTAGALEKTTGRFGGGDARTLRTLVREMDRVLQVLDLAG